MEEKAGLELDESFKVTAYPTLLIIALDGKEIVKLVGYHKAPELQTELDKVLSNW